MFVGVKEAAQQLNVSQAFLRKLVRENRVTFYKLSERTTRFDLAEVREYMKLVAEGRPKAK